MDTMGEFAWGSPNMKLLSQLLIEADRRRLEYYGRYLQTPMKSGEDTEIYRKRLQYAVQENERHHQGLATPARVQQRIDALETGDGGLLFMAKQKAVQAKGKARSEGPSVGSIAREAIMAGKSFEETEKLVVKAFPESKFNKVCYSWYRNNLKKKGMKVPELKGKAPAKAAPAKAAKAAPAKAAPAKAPKLRPTDQDLGL
jgi:hypothetical protein